MPVGDRLQLSKFTDHRADSNEENTLSISLATLDKDASLKLIGYLDCSICDYVPIIILIFQSERQIIGIPLLV